MSNTEADARNRTTGTVSGARRLLAGAIWIYGSQLGTASAQFVYAMFTSRLVAAGGFEDYGVALAVFGLVSLFANAGLAQAVSRLRSIERSIVRGLFSYSLMLGMILCLFLFFTAEFWAGVWGVAGAANVVKTFAVGILAAPASGLLQGLSRRSGDFKFLSLCSLGNNILGMLAGVLAVAVFRTPSALAVSMIATQWLNLGSFLIKYRKIAAGLASLAHARSELGFAWRLLGPSLLGYLNGNIGKFAVTNSLAAGALGYWNRADVLTTVPLMQAQNALVSAAYPEFRHAKPGSGESASRWSDMLLLSAWVSCPAGVLLSAVVPFVVSTVFGPGWATSAWLAGPLALVGGLQIPATLLSSAIESLGKFRSLIFVQLVLALLYAGSAIVCFITHEWAAIICGLVAAPFLQHGIQVWWASRSGLVRVQVVLRGYIVLVGVCVALYFSVSHAVGGLYSGSLGDFIVGLVMIGALFALLYVSRSRLAPYVIARRRGLIGSGWGFSRRSRRIEGARHLRRY